jgi:hypothetical protein
MKTTVATVDKIKRATSTEINNHIKDIDEGSITPRTLMSREVFQDINDLKNSANSTVIPQIQDALFYRETYSHDTWNSQILHFGINSYNKKIRSELVQHNKTQKNNISLSSLSDKSNASNTTKYGEFVKVINPTSYEKELVEYVTSKSLKVCLIDIFPRTLKKDSTKNLELGDIEIPGQDTEPLATHTVILYKNSQGKFLVIDPSNPKFSGHLKNLNLTVDVPDESHKIYAPKTGVKTGPKKDEYRDCTDIAVKLAALLDKDTTDYQDLDGIMKSEAVRLVSNQGAITKVVIEDKPIRIKQVSNLDKTKEINESFVSKNNAYQQNLKNKKEELRIEQEALKQKYQVNFDQITSSYENDLVSLIGQFATQTELEGGFYDT